MSKTDSSFNADQYATVADRIELFYSRFPEGRINTELVERRDGEITFKALVYRTATETLAAATGWASEREGDGDINLVACLENTETSAVGRALANLGFTASAQRPSAEEMLKASRMRVRLTPKGEREVARQVPVLHVQSVPTVTPALADFLRLLTRAERAGVVRPRRAARWRREARGAAPEALERYEQRLRARLTRREG